LNVERNKIVHIKVYPARSVAYPFLKEVLRIRWRRAIAGIDPAGCLFSTSMY